MARKPAALLGSLVTHLGGCLDAGAGTEGEIVLEDGLVAEVRILVSRRPSRDAAVAYKAQFLEWLGGSVWSAESCQVEVNPGKKWHTSKPAHRCRSSVVAAVVWISPTLGPRFLCVCGRHRTAHGIRLSTVMGVLPLSSADLEPARLAREAQRAESFAESRRDDALDDLGFLWLDRKYLLAPNLTIDRRLDNAGLSGARRDVVRRILEEPAGNAHKTARELMAAEREPDPSTLPHNDLGHGTPFVWEKKHGT